MARLPQEPAARTLAKCHACYLQATADVRAMVGVFMWLMQVYDNTFGSPPCEAVESEKLVHLVHSFVAGLSLPVEWPFRRRVGCSTSAGTSCAPAPPPRNVRGVPLPRSARDLHPAAAKFTQPCGATCGCMQIHAACAAPALIPCSLFGQVARFADDTTPFHQAPVELRY